MRELIIILQGGIERTLKLGKIEFKIFFLFQILKFYFLFTNK